MSYVYKVSKKEAPVLIRFVSAVSVRFDPFSKDSRCGNSKSWTAIRSVREYWRQVSSDKIKKFNSKLQP